MKWGDFGEDGNEPASARHTSSSVIPREPRAVLDHRGLDSFVFRNLGGQAPDLFPALIDAKVQILDRAVGDLQIAGLADVRAVSANERFPGELETLRADNIRLQRLLKLSEAPYRGLPRRGGRG